jgi:branched-chain amino acid transport system ATP-binding protein
MAAEALLEVSGVEAGYGRVPVLRGVGFRAGMGEIVALLGPNGAGKTTLLRVVAGVLAPWRGSVRVGGTEVAGLAPERVVAAGVALVPEGRRLFPGLTVTENLLLGGYSRGRADLTPDLERVYSVFPRLAERAGQVAGRLSGGEQQMCAIGRALMSRPRLLLIDELSLGLAPAVVEDLLALLPELTAGGTGIVLVEQDVEAALSVAARGYLLELGAVTREGPGTELLADPRLQDAYLGTFPLPGRQASGNPP